MSTYIIVDNAENRVPLLTDHSIKEYERLNVVPHRGTSYGEVERVHLAELKLARKLGSELLRVGKKAMLEVNL